MRVRVRLFAPAPRLVGAGELERDVPAEATVRLLWESLTREFSELSQYAASISSAVNAEYARMETLLQNDDEVAFLPPVSGGSD